MMVVRGKTLVILPEKIPEMNEILFDVRLIMHHIFLPHFDLLLPIAV